MPDIKTGIPLCTVPSGTAILRCDNGILEMREPDGTLVTVDLWNLTITRTYVSADCKVEIAIGHRIPV
jgi:hypothetical protein